jgi:hypothetical protein
VPAKSANEKRQRKALAKSASEKVYILLLIKICYLKKKLINFLDGSRDFVETDRTSNSSWSIYSDRDNQGSAAGFPANPETPPQRPSSLSGNNNRYVRCHGLGHFFRGPQLSHIYLGST